MERSYFTAALIFLGFLVYYQQISLVKGINSPYICDDSLEPEYCIMCFLSNPNSNSDFPVAFGGISINCTASQAIVAQNVLLEYACNETDQKSKVWLDGFVKVFDIIKLNLTSVYDSWRAGNYAVAGNQTDWASELYHNCTAEIPVGGYFPVGLYAPLKKFQAYCNVVIGVMGKLV